MPPLLGSDGPGAARVVGLADGGVVLSLAVGAPDRVDGRQVEDVEAQGGDVRNQRLGRILTTLEQNRRIERTSGGWTLRQAAPDQKPTPELPFA